MELKRIVAVNGHVGRKYDFHSLAVYFSNSLRT